MGVLFLLVDLSSKVIVITGSSRGIGKELALAFSQENSNVVIVCKNCLTSANLLCEEINSRNGNSIVVQANVENKNDVLQLYKMVSNTYGRLDVLINNAGICDDNMLNLMSLKQWESVINTNLTGTFLCSKYLSRIMIRQGYGKIINIASLKGQTGSEGQVNYSASKAGVIGLTKSLAIELGRFGISVNAVCPGFIVTDLNRHDKEKAEIANNNSVMNIGYSLSDTVKFILYMASENLMGTSGQVFNLDSRIR